MDYLPLEQRAMLAKCRMHLNEKAAVCPKCYDKALEQQTAQWVRERKRAHKHYVAGKK